eukprot:478291-Prymnesium_polylepis.2
MVQTQEWRNPHLRFPAGILTADSDTGSKMGDGCEALADARPTSARSLARRWILEVILQIFDAELADG